MSNVHHLGNREGAYAGHDLSADAHFKELFDQVSRSMAELQRAWGEHIDATSGWGGAGATIPADAMGGMDLKFCVRAAKRLLDLRKRILGEDLFSGPGWAILLQLFESHTLQRTDTVGQVCVATDLPCTTVLRWLKKLSEEGFVELRDDHLDGRRRFAELSHSGVQLMTQYFSGAAPNLVAA